MKTKSNGSWLVVALTVLGVFVAAFFGAEKKAEAVSGNWGIVKQVFLDKECIYAVVARNELDIDITGIGVRTQFFDSYNANLGVFNLLGDTYIAPWSSEVVGWRIPSICTSVDRAKIIKSVAAY